jgi:bacteriorhodopsin
MTPDLTIGQYTLVYNVLSFVIAAMLGSFFFFVLSRDQVNRKYRLAITVSAVVVLVAAYHYFRIFNSWTDAYTVDGNAYTPTGFLFNDAYRYVDWLITVPLLMVELIAVLALPKATARSLLAQLVIAAVLMIGLGYPGEISRDFSTRMLFFCLSMIPFLYILYVLYFRLSDAIANQPETVKNYVSILRNLTLVAWCFYPIAYLLHMNGSSNNLVAVQVEYSIADVVAKCGYGLIIYWIAKEKTELEDKLGNRDYPRDKEFPKKELA